jgi:hypothetical protein
MTLNVTNAIFKGAGHDVVVATPSSTADATLNTTRCDYSSKSLQPGPGNIAVHETHLVSAAPIFVAPATGNFTEQLSSPTVDAGAATMEATDVIGNPRTLGSRVDIGGYEFEPAPAVHHVKAKAGKHKLHVSASVNPGGLSTKASLKVTHGHQVIHSQPVSVGAGRTPVAAHLSVGGLHRHTKYHVRLKARSAGGVTRKTIIVTTH